jgi:hypothetical protein
MNPRKSGSPYCLCGDRVQPGSHTCQRKGCAEMWRRITERSPEIVIAQAREEESYATANR